jgi:hypothetical protein
MKKIGLITIMVFAVTFVSFGQIFEDICATPDNEELKSAEAAEWYDFDNEPVKYVRIRLVFLRNDNGLGGFDPSNSAHQTYINDKINILNSTYSNLQTSYNNECYNGSQGLYSDSKVRFSIQTLYLNNTYYWNNLNSTGTYGCPDEAGYHLNNLRDSLEELDTYPVLNVFFTENANAYQNILVNQNCPLPNNVGFQSVSCSQYPKEASFEYKKQSVHMRNKFLKYYWMMTCVANNAFNNPDWPAGYPTVNEAYAWLNAGWGLAHELGHSLFLTHVLSK